MKTEPTPKRKDAEAARKKALKVPKDALKKFGNYNNIS